MNNKIIKISVLFLVLIILVSAKPKGCATTKPNVIHYTEPDSHRTPSYFTGEAQSREDLK